MTKLEFISRLRAALNGKVPPVAVAENVNYYEDYINMEVRKGRTEEEVLASLGDPRLIARTIVETSGRRDGGEYQGGTEETGYREYGQHTGHYSANDGYSQSGQYDSQNGFGHRNENHRGRIFRVPVWVWALAVVLLVAFVISLFFSILSFLMPILLPILLVVFLVKLFRDWLN